MENSRPCKSCRERTLVPDDVTGNMVCISCGVVQDFDNFQAHMGGLTGPTGTYVRLGTAGTGSVYNYKETKLYEAQKLIEDLMFKLGFSAARSDEVKSMVVKITEGEYGAGRWFLVLVGACAYVVTRKDGKTTPLGEVANVVCCDVYELGRMVNRVVEFLELDLPGFDVVGSFERAVRSIPSLSGVSEDLIRRMLKQGLFLLQSSVKWFLTTGRRPIPVVVAVLVLVAELNQVEVKMDNVAGELNVSVVTCKKRYKELLERLVRVARSLPWGNDVTVKNVLKYAPSVIQYMEVKSMSQCGEKKKSPKQVRFELNDLVSDCLIKEKYYGSDYNDTEKDALYFEADNSHQLGIGGADQLQISHECLALIYSKFLNEVSAAKSAVDNGEENKRNKMRRFDLTVCTDWWQGKSDLSKKLMLKQIFEKDVGLDAMPPSFDRASLVYERRREKIKLAKIRIQGIMQPSGPDLGNPSDCCLSNHVTSGKKRKKLHVQNDWEDLIIETLLLHQVREEEIEKGHYNVLLDLHVFNHVCAEDSAWSNRLKLYRKG